MKKVICFILVVIIICMAGCRNNTASMEKPVSCYYCTTQENYETLRKVISFEVRDAAPYGEQTQRLLNDYLSGPTSDSLRNPFPKGCIVESVEKTDSTTTIILNSNFARLSGVALTLACACLSLTVFDILDCENVSIRVQNELLDGKSEILLHRDDIMLEYINDLKTDSE